MSLSTPSKLLVGMTLALGTAVVGFRYGRSVNALTPAAPSAAAQPDASLDAGAPAAAPELGPGADASAELDSPAPATPPGAYEPPPIIVDGHPRVYPLTRNVWVKPGPSSARSWIGFLWFGSSVRLRDERPRSGPGCRGGQWYAIEPRGFVCVDDESATLDPTHPALVSVSRYAPNLASAWPHRYGKSIDARVYRSLPSVKRQRAHEWYYGSHLERVQRALSGEVLEELAGIDLTPAPAIDLGLSQLPRNLQTARTRLIRRSTVAWSRETLHEGRSFLLSSDLKWIPKDRVVVYPTVTFRGVHLGQQASLPLAFFRKRDREAYVPAGEGFEPIDQTFARLSWVELTGRERQVDEELYLETRRDGLWVRAADAVVPRVREETPWGTPLSAREDPRAPWGRQTWMEASILGGWLLAYEGRTPVFATLISAGRGGPPHGDVDPVETASTPVGQFKITGKFATATMVAPNDLTHSSVPWAQNFSGPHALHAAYWHDDWGELKSGGCINVSPLDGRWLFREFTEPNVPEGWHGVRWLPKLERATTLIVRRR